MNIGTIFLFVMAVFGLWKIHNLLFGESKYRDLQDKLQSEINQKIVLNQFFGDFTYKAIKGNKKYKDAPQEIFDFLKTNYDEWAKEKLEQLRTKK